MSSIEWLPGVVITNVTIKKNVVAVVLINPQVHQFIDVWNFVRHSSQSPHIVMNSVKKKIGNRKKPNKYIVTKLPT